MTSPLSVRLHTDTANDDGTTRFDDLSFTATRECIPVVDIGQAAATVACDITTGSSASKIDTGLTVAAIDANNFLQGLLVDTVGNPHILVLAKHDAGTPTILGSVSTTISPSTTYRPTLTFDGVTLTIALGGSVASYTLTGAEQTKYAAGTKAGMRINVGPNFDDGTSRFDNFEADIKQGWSIGSIEW